MSPKKPTDLPNRPRTRPSLPSAFGNANISGSFIVENSTGSTKDVRITARSKVQNQQNGRPNVEDSVTILNSDFDVGNIHLQNGETLVESAPNPPQTPDKDEPDSAGGPPLVPSQALPLIEVDHTSPTWPPIQPGNVQFVVQNQVLSVSRLHLLSKSLTMKIFFTGHNRFIVHNFDSEVFRSFLDYVQDSEKGFPEEYAAGLLALANKFDIVDLKDICENILKHKGNPESVC